MVDLGQKKVESYSAFFYRVNPGKHNNMKRPQFAAFSFI